MSPFGLLKSHQGGISISTAHGDGLLPEILITSGLVYDKYMGKMLAEVDLLDLQVISKLAILTALTFFSMNIKEKMFRGIDNDEAAFLELASKQQAEIDGRRYAVTAEVKEFRVSFYAKQVLKLNNTAVSKKIQ